jgi:hypothetical protein
MINLPIEDILGKNDHDLFPRRRPTSSTTWTARSSPAASSSTSPRSRSDEQGMLILHTRDPAARRARPPQYLLGISRTSPSASGRARASGEEPAARGGVRVRAAGAGRAEQAQGHARAVGEAGGAGAARGGVATRSTTAGVRDEQTSVGSSATARRWRACSSCTAPADPYMNGCAPGRRRRWVEAERIDLPYTQAERPRDARPLARGLRASSRSSATSRVLPQEAVGRRAAAVEPQRGDVVSR